ncbi:MAG: VWA domain-containing protein [Rhodothermales bacterium]
MLRRLGFNAGPAQMLIAMEAVQMVGVRRKEDVQQALKACLVQRREEIDLFDQAFQLFWKAPSRLPEVMKWLLQNTKIPSTTDTKGYHRVQEALREAAKPPGEASEEASESRIEIDQIVTYSATELLRKKDFAAFTNDEVAAAKKYMARFSWPVPPYPTRRFTPSVKGKKLDFRKTVQLGSKSGGEILQMAFQGKKRKPRPVVLICDISGSMERYARMLLHFMHAMTGDKRKVESFVFGTRMTRISHLLKYRDVDEAVSAVSKEVVDWAGGTKIGDAIKTFNFEWLRRVLNSNSVVLIISDGWDRGDRETLSKEMYRLKRSCHRLIWLNPLMGYEQYEPLTQGMQAALPYVDNLLSVHNLLSLEHLAKTLAQLK